ncbi:MAG: dockerin type I repeat-containing protein [Ruminococcus sp.]|nr:dockerin type I repeat-containing protein [Ruminococcus sp.]
MRKILSKAAAFISAAAMAVCGVCGGFTAVAADEEPVTYKISYDFGTEDFEVDEKTDITQFETYETNAPYVLIPKGTFFREDYGFAGWTVDGFYGYRSGETYTIPDDTYEIVLKAVWVDYNDTSTYKITYDLSFEGREVEAPEWIVDREYNANTIVSPNYSTIDIGDAVSHGYCVDGEPIDFNSKFVMPSHDIVITVQWFKRVNFTFYAGDVDRLNGNDTVTFPRTEGSRSELSGSDRFSRNGFNLAGWLSDYDGQVYKCGETVDVPGVDVTYTAVWEPKNYNVIFIPGNGGTNIKVPGATDTKIVCPEPGIKVSGKHFAGWKDSDGEIHRAGDEYLIKGAIPGSGISLTAVWAAGEEPETTTAAQVEAVLFGDANDDGIVDIADATIILQHIGNGDKYKLSAVGAANADCYYPGTGITALDALAVQEFDAKVMDELPEWRPPLSE